MRYELKFLFSCEEYEAVLKRMHDNAYGIREIYCERQINNIYLDTLGYSDYLANFHGDDQRLKYRIRWYGQLHGKIEKPVLELKYKQEALGGKRMAEVPEFNFDEHFSWQNYARILRTEMLDLSPEGIAMYSEVLGRIPALVNTYTRRYFMTANTKYRLTVDQNMNFYTLQSAVSSKSDLFATHDPHILLEVKFEEADLDGAKGLINSLGYRVYKNSKYSNGIQSALYGAQLV